MRGLGPRCRKFEPFYPDHIYKVSSTGRTIVSKTIYGSSSLSPCARKLSNFNTEGNIAVHKRIIGFIEVEPICNDDNKALPPLWRIAKR